MRVRLLAFASAADALGRGELEVELPAGSRVADLRARLEREHPALAPLWARLAVAVDGELAAPDAELPAGAEVALLPPVSGGSGGSRVSGGTADTAESILLTESPLSPAAAVAAVAGPGRGAVVLFLGSVRDQHRGRQVEGIRYSAYLPMAERALARIAAELEAAQPELRVAIHHRLGSLAVGEPSVAIATASPHREAAYHANREALERLKRETPIWKRERYADGSSAWREEEPLAPQWSLSRKDSS